jgi:hypothetical protein
MHAGDAGLRISVFPESAARRDSSSALKPPEFSKTSKPLRVIAAALSCLVSGEKTTMHQ